MGKYNVDKNTLKIYLIIGGNFMANNLYGHSINNNMNQEVQDNGEVELASYMDDNCGTCARCGSRECLNNSNLCSNCSEMWG